MIHVGNLILVKDKIPYENVLGIYLASYSHPKIKDLIYHDIIDCKTGRIRSYLFPEKTEKLIFEELFL